MVWSLCRDVGTFLAAAEGFLAARPVENTALLTEAAYLRARPAADPGDQLFGWWRPDAGAPVGGAFLRAPRHPAILSPMPGVAVAELAATCPGLPPVGVDGRQARAARAAWPGLTGGPGLTVLRLAGLRAPAPPPGRPRTATAADRDLLVGWFRALMAANPGDPSDLAYVVDDPLTFGGITLWEVGGEPRAMAGRSRLVAGMVRVGAVHAVTDPADGAAAFAAACAAAAAIADHVLVFGTADERAGHRALGFAPVLTRVLLRPPSPGPS